MINSNLREAVNSALENSKSNIIDSLTTLIKIQSFESEAIGDSPFGQGPTDALNSYLAMGEALGFETGRVGNYSGHIIWNPTEKPLSEDAGILVHLDVVPADDSSWTYPPYDGTVTKDSVYGRGSQDNKGPAAAVLYALKALKDVGYTPKRGIRLIAGTNEETGSKDIPKYLEKFPQPVQSIVPDGCYPVVHAEKGIMNIRLTTPLTPLSDSISEVLEFSGGTARNMVPDYCRLLLAKGNLNVSELTDLVPSDLRVMMTISEVENGILFETTGKSVHGAMPEKGRNAVSLMMELLPALPIKSQVSEFTEFFNRRLGKDCYGKLMGCDCLDEVSGQLRVNVGVLSLDGDNIILDLNLRYPVTANGEDIFEIVRSNSAVDGMIGELLVNSKPLYFPVDDPFIKMLHKEYITETGDTKTAPVVMGGGTYARTLQNATAIGGRSPFSEDLAHQVDEYILIEDLMASARIYAGILIKMTEK